MNIKFLFITVMAFFAFQVFPLQANAQEGGNTMSYKIPNLYYQADGKTTQLEATVEYDDTTHVIQGLNWEVNLLSFINTYGGTYNYIAAYGNASVYPWMQFESKKVKDKGDKVQIQGTLYYRGEYRPLTIVANKVIEDNQLYLYGDFTISLREYYMLNPVSIRIPPYISMNFNFVFNMATPEQVEG